MRGYVGLSSSELSLFLERDKFLSVRVFQREPSLRDCGSCNMAGISASEALWGVLWKKADMLLNIEEEVCRWRGLFLVAIWPVDAEPGNGSLLDDACGERILPFAALLSFSLPFVLPLPAGFRWEKRSFSRTSNLASSVASSSLLPPVSSGSP